MTYSKTPPKASVLHALGVPESVDDTHYANMFAVNDALAHDLKESIEETESEVLFSRLWAHSINPCFAQANRCRPADTLA